MIFNIGLICKFPNRRTPLLWHIWCFYGFDFENEQSLRNKKGCIKRTKIKVCPPSVWIKQITNHINHLVFDTCFFFFFFIHHFMLIWRYFHGAVVYLPVVSKALNYCTFQLCMVREPTVYQNLDGSFAESAHSVEQGWPNIKQVYTEKWALSDFNYLNRCFPILIVNINCSKS